MSEWIANAFWAKIGWTLGSLAIAGCIWVAILLLIIPRMVRQSRCKHLRYHETGACDAICNDCGKNLGFIGRIRDR